MHDTTIYEHTRINENGRNGGGSVACVVALCSRMRCTLFLVTATAKTAVVPLGLASWQVTVINIPSCCTPYIGTPS